MSETKRPSRHVFGIKAVGVSGRFVLLCDCGHDQPLNANINGTLPLSEVDKYVVRHHRDVMDIKNGTRREKGSDVECCEHGAERHGPEAGGCIECRCTATAKGSSQTGEER